MLKKIGAVVLAVTLIVMVLAACGGGADTNVAQPPAQETPNQGSDVVDTPPADNNQGDDALALEITTIAFQSYTDLLESMSGADVAYDIDFTMVMDMSMDDGFSMSMPTSGNMRMSVDGDTLRTSMTMDMGMGMGVLEFYMEMVGNEVTFVQQSIDGVEVDFFSSEDMLEILNSSINMPDVDFNAIVSAEIEEAGGQTIINMVFDGHAISDFALASVADQLGDLGVDMDMQLEDMPFTIVKDSAGNPVSMSMYMNMTLEAEGEAFTMSITSEFVFNAFGSGVVIEMPV